MPVVVLNHGIVRDTIASVHKQGCSAIEREQLTHASMIYGPYETVEDALTAYIDSEMEEMGWSRRDVKIHACCK